MPIGSLAAAGDFWKIIREFNPEGIEREATSPLDLWVLGEPGSGRHTLVESLAGESPPRDGPDIFRFAGLPECTDVPPELKHADLLLLVARVDQDFTGVARIASALVGRSKAQAILVFTHADAIELTRELRNRAFRSFSFVSYTRTIFVDARDPAEVRDKLAPLILDSAPGLRTALARKIPAVRQMVADQLIAETARVNAQFALAASIPSNLPLFGGVASGIADFFVLTKNQAMLVLRLGAIYGRDISIGRTLAAELAPVIGNGILWRSVARGAASLVPGFLSAAPKTAIAYVGTYAAGQAAKYYFNFGQKPQRQLGKRFSAEGARLYRRMLSREAAAEGRSA